MTDRTWRWALAVLGAVDLALAAWAAVDAGSFTDRVADFGPQNAHLVHDFAAASATFGVGLLLAARVRAWRTPVLAISTIWTGLHAVSHLVDAGEAHPDAVGPIEAVALLAATGLLAVLTWLSMQSTDTTEER
jgi:hypothetical protein